MEVDSPANDADEDEEEDAGEAERMEAIAAVLDVGTSFHRCRLLTKGL